MQAIQMNDLLRLTEESSNKTQSCSLSFSTYLSWSRLNLNFEENLEIIGILSGGNEAEGDIYAGYDSNNYWSPNFPIDLRLYPYSGCYVCKHIQTGCYFLIYTELGGHGAEKRCRLVQRRLILVI